MVTCGTYGPVFIDPQSDDRQVRIFLRNILHRGVELLNLFIFGGRITGAVVMGNEGDCAGIVLIDGNFEPMEDRIGGRGPILPCQGLYRPGLGYRIDPGDIEAGHKVVDYRQLYPAIHTVYNGAK